MIALLVLVDERTPILYRGERVGRGGRVFTMYKFRTLRRDAERRLGPYLGEELVAAHEAEFTPVGRWLKATQLDEIPQFSTSLRGDMSLVGPRPIRPRVLRGARARAAVVLAAARRAARPDRLRPGAARLRDVDGARSSRTTSSGSPTAPCASTSARVVATGWRVAQAVGRED